MRRHESKAEAKNALYQLFEEHSSELYWLAFLLTGDREQSVQAFTKALDLEDGVNPVFQRFMVAWSRKLVIAASLATIDAELRESALRTAQPRQDSASLGLPSHPWMSDRRMTRPEVERAVLAIEAFPRCAVLLTVFERLSIENAASLLNADEALVRTAQRVGLTELTRNIALGRGWRPARTTTDMWLARAAAPIR